MSTTTTRAVEAAMRLADECKKNDITNEEFVAKVDEDYELSSQQLTLDGKPEWWYDLGSTWSPPGHAPRGRTQVTCEPCKNGGGPQDCVRPCVTYSRSPGERLFP